MAHGGRGIRLTRAGKLLLLLIITAAAAVWYTQNRVVKGGDIFDIAKVLPADTPSLLAVRGFIDLGRQLEAQKAQQTPESQQALADLKAWSTRELGIDLSDPQAIAKSGFDFTTPWAVSQQGSTDPRQADAVLLIPVLNADAALSTVQTALEKQRRPTQLRPVGERTFYVVDGGAAFTLEDGWLTAISSDRAGFDPVVALQRFLDRDRSQPLAGVPDFRQLMQDMGDDWQLMGYSNAGVLEQALASVSDAVSGTLEARTPLAFSLHLTDQRIRGRLGSLDRDTRASRLFRGGQEDTLGARVDADAFTAFRSSLDLAVLWEELNRKPESQKKLEEARAGLQEGLGIDLKTDLIDGLDGRFTVLGVRGAPGGDPVGVVAWAGLRDATRTRGVVETAVSRLPRSDAMLQADGTDDDRWFVTEAGGLGITRGHLVVCAGRGLLPAVRASLQNGGSGYQASFNEAVREQLTKGAALYGYVDARETLNAAATLAQQRPLQAALANIWLQPAREAVDALLSGISVGVDARGQVSLLDLELHAPPGGFTGARAWLEQKFKSLNEKPWWRP